MIEGWLLGSDHARATSHIDACDECRRLVALAVQSGAAAPGSEPTIVSEPTKELSPGTRVGRYEIRHPIGAGGMGVVYEAYDVELQRRLALKVLRRKGRRSADSRARLLREARAMAQLAHPNVVHIYDVGVFEDQVFIGMELVDGVTLRQWLRRAPRDWIEVVRAFLGAGRGLAAAHAAGIVHRDFKPDNLLIARDGRARVTDFGVARAFDSASEHGTTSGVADLVVTRAGTIVGTPAYMSPEQLASGAIDARSDQFSFCIALYEALYGSRPHSGTTVDELKLSIEAGPTAPFDTRGAPPELFDIVRRGLHPAVDQRYPNLERLLEALDAIAGEANGRVPRKSRRGASIVAASVAVAMAIGLVVWVLAPWRAESASPSPVERATAPQPAPAPAPAPAPPPAQPRQTVIPEAATSPPRASPQRQRPATHSAPKRTRKAAPALPLDGDGLVPYGR